MVIDKKRICRVRASVYPTPHNKIWLSSGRVPLHNFLMHYTYLNFMVGGKDG